MQHVWTIAESFVRIGMHLEKIAVGTEGFCSESHGRHKLAVACCGAVASAWTLYAVGAVHDDAGGYLKHIWDVAEVNDKIVITERIAALSEPYLLASALLHLVDRIFHVGSTEKLCLLDVDSLAGLGCCHEQIRLTAEKGWYLYDINHLSDGLCLISLMNVGEQAETVLLLDIGKLDGNHVVTTVMANLGLFKALDKAGIETEVTTVGDKYVNEAMVKNGYVLGGEQSGHIIFKRHATTGDGVLTAIMLMEVMMEEKTSISELASGMKKYPQLLKNVKVTDRTAVMENEQVKAECEAISEELGDEGRILLRESGTEPLIRVMVEAGTDELCKKYVDRMCKVVESL